MGEGEIIDDSNFTEGTSYCYCWICTRAFPYSLKEHDAKFHSENLESNFVITEIKNGIIYMKNLK